MKTEDTSKQKSILVQRRDYFKHTDQCLEPSDTNVLIKGMKSSNACIDWLGI